MDQSRYLVRVKFKSGVENEIFFTNKDELDVYLNNLNHYPDTVSYEAEELGPEFQPLATVAIFPRHEPAFSQPGHALRPSALASQ